MKTGKFFCSKKYKLMMYGDKSMKGKGSNFGTANFVWKWFIFILDSHAFVLVHKDGLISLVLNHL